MVQAEHSRKARETFMNQRDDQRAQELSNLKLALATFAVRLDAFEVRTNRRLTITKPGRLELSSPDIGPVKQVAEPMKS
jgi:hypothetical protein